MVSGVEPPADVDIWQWSAPETWKPQVLDLMGDLISPDVIQTFRDEPPEHVQAGDLAWLNRIIQRRAGVRSADVRSVLAGRLAERYRWVRAFHAAKVPDAMAIYRDGLAPVDGETMRIRAAEVLGALSRAPQHREAVAAAIRAVDGELLDEVISLDLSLPRLLEERRHARAAGEDFLIAVADALRPRVDAVHALRTIGGRPTVFACNVPMDGLDAATRADFAGLALARIFEGFMGGTLSSDDAAPTHFALRVPLDGASVVGHAHPSLDDRPTNTLSWVLREG